jgi:hypothetical protein
MVKISQRLLKTFNCLSDEEIRRVTGLNDVSGIKTYIADYTTSDGKSCFNLLKYALLGSVIRPVAEEVKQKGYTEVDGDVMLIMALNETKDFGFQPCRRNSIRHGVLFDPNRFAVLTPDLEKVISAKEKEQVIMPNVNCAVKLIPKELYDVLKKRAEERKEVIEVDLS